MLDQSNIFELHPKPFELVGSLKLKIEDETDTTSDQQRLKFGGKEPKDDKKLNDSNTKNECTAHMILKYKEGGESGFEPFFNFNLIANLQ